MFKTIIQYGLFCGVFISLVLLLGLYLLKIGQLQYSQTKTIGMVSMLIAYFFIFILLKKINHYKPIGLGSALSVSLGIVIIASIIYSFTWTYYIFKIEPQIVAKIAAYSKQYYANKGLSSSNLAIKYSEINKLGALYQKPISCFIITITDPLFIGLLISILASLWVVKTKKKLVKQ